ncbi:hypothetical protein ACGFNU_23805 [Spirillospora sp. NPDC048911]|uniref:hypothetical protein n=1 Tax=Spirillospora sp. NPDC048911 TaxID=3364527 RepID=UPI00371A9360
MTAVVLTFILIGAAVGWGVKKLFFDEPETYTRQTPAYAPRMSVHQAARTLVTVTLQAIRNWLGHHSTAAYADIIRRHLANGQVNVVSIGLTAYGHQVASKSWTGPVATDLNAAFGTAHQFRLYT